MKKKIRTAILLTLVVGIWGVVIYKVVGSRPSDIKRIGTRDTTQKIKESLTPYVIHAYSRDPFLSILKDTMEVIIPASKPKKPTNRAAHENVSLPEYSGLIQNGHSVLAIIKWKNRYRPLVRGDTFDQFKLNTIAPLYITVTTKGQQHKIPLTGTHNSTITTAVK